MSVQTIELPSGEVFTISDWGKPKARWFQVVAPYHSDVVC